MEPQTAYTLLRDVKLKEQVTAVNLALHERDFQDEKWGSQRHLSHREWLAILVEEVGEAAKDILDEKPDGFKTEITQVAAVAVAWLEAFIARSPKKEYSSGCPVCGGFRENPA